MIYKFKYKRFITTRIAWAVTIE